MSKKGIDISYCQAGFDLSKAKDIGIEFAIIRAGIGKTDTSFGTFRDSQLINHVMSAEKLGMQYGFYWYSGAHTVAQAKTEAEACLEFIKKYAPAYPVFYDMEEQWQIDELSTSTRTDIIVAFCEAIKEAGHIAGVYINPSWMENYVDKSRIVGKYDIWLAHWTEDPNIPSSYDYGQTIWQWGLDHIDGKGVDGDICFKDYPAKPANDEPIEYKPVTQEVVDAVIRGDYGNGQERIDKLAAEGYDPAEVQKAVDESLSNPKSYKPVTQEVVNAVIRGDYGNGEERREKLEADGYDPDEVQKAVDEELSKPDGVGTTAPEITGELVIEVIRGEWGNGQERIDRLTAAGYDAAKVQAAVDAYINNY